MFLLPFWRLLWRWDIIVERWSNVWVASNAVVHDLTYFSIDGNLASHKFDKQNAGEEEINLSIPIEHNPLPLATNQRSISESER